MEKIKLTVPVIVEGKYDKAAVTRVIDGLVVTTDGFRVFKSGEKRALIRRVSENGVVVLTDSDGAGGVIRSYLNGIVPKEKIFPLYAPQIKGKERRKSAPSKAGFLGVEGVGDTVLRDLFARLREGHPELFGGGAAGREVGGITKTDFFELGLSGGESSSSRRDALAESLGLPRGMMANGLLGAVNMICTRDDFLKLAGEIRKCGEE
ncbi:MAG: DUF4093 domain-containing protein [Clostridia bacterium]|nr:DUF4093 domain-containing protein [Clostridia bacterium]